MVDSGAKDIVYSCTRMAVTSTILVQELKILMVKNGWFSKRNIIIESSTNIFGHFLWFLVLFLNKEYSWFLNKNGWLCYNSGTRIEGIHG